VLCRTIRVEERWIMIGSAPWLTRSAQMSCAESVRADHDDLLPRQPLTAGVRARMALVAPERLLPRNEGMTGKPASPTAITTCSGERVTGVPWRTSETCHLPVAGSREMPLHSVLVHTPSSMIPA